MDPYHIVIIVASILIIPVITLLFVSIYQLVKLCRSQKPRKTNIHKSNKINSKKIPKSVPKPIDAVIPIENTYINIFPEVHGIIFVVTVNVFQNLLFFQRTITGSKNVLIHRSQALLKMNFVEVNFIECIPKRADIHLFKMSYKQFR